MRWDFCCSLHNIVLFHPLINNRFMEKRIVCIWFLVLVVFMSAFMFSCKKIEINEKTYDIHHTDTTVVCTVNGSVFTMVLVEGGTFVMGATEEQGHEDPDENEYPVHVVNLSSYYICQTEVTQELWNTVMGTNPAMIHGDLSLPVDCVKWDMCQEFIQALNEMLDYKYQIRMPTEAEWEFAARGGNKSKGYKYSGSNILDEVAWYGSNAEGVTHPVGTKKSNELGLYDMSGNLWEWCQDWIGHYQPEEQTNPIGPAEGTHRIMRGGSWTYDQNFCRVSRRNYISNVIGVSNCGLRLAMTL